MHLSAIKSCYSCYADTIKYHIHIVVKHTTKCFEFYVSDTKRPIAHRKLLL